ncbi:hypothetical protein [Leclercia adecarboxylata]|uniref:hypothetical protein n=1 Tax=Leclercia adecarboxylata TaxID=83655 RepID=UPI00254E682F|nr:hypothetical protein [Leclercia adecarboxylata]
MENKTLFATAVAVLMLSGCVQKNTARNCDQAVEVAYRFTEHAISMRPQLAYAPVRNEADSALFWLACRDGLQKGAAHDNTRLMAMQNYISNAVVQPGISAEDGRYLINDMAIFLAHQYGFESASS